MAAKASSSRDNSIDLLRGFALVSIFINHIPGNPLEPFTMKNFGLSDSAELFVLLAGIAAAFAYLKLFLAGNRLVASARAVKRAGLLYVAHLASTMVGIGIFAAGVVFLGKPELFDQINLASIRDVPVAAMAGIPLMTHQLGYHNILPMYVCLLLLVPLLMLLAARSLGLMLGFSIAVYAATQVFGWNMPNYPTPGGWFFNPFAWQLIFSIGLYVGARLQRGETPVPFNPYVWVAAALYLVGAGVYHRWNLYGSIPEIPFLPHNFQINEKPWVAAPRLAHILSLAYVVGHSPVIRWLRNAGPRNPLSLLTLLGRHALPVFWLGTALSMGGQVLTLGAGIGAEAQLAYIAAGVAAQLTLAFWLDRAGAARKAKAAEGAAPSVRDGSIDILRGVALISILINHVPGSVLDPLTINHFGPSGAAELFVLLAGIAATFAYFKRFQAGAPLAASARAVNRAVLLYVSQLALVAVSIGIFYGGAILAGDPALLEAIGLAPLRDQQAAALAGIPLLAYQLEFHDILPLYVVLLVVLPALMLLAARSLTLMLCVSVAVYAAAHAFGWTLPTWPAPGGWYFNPLAWQLIFAIGVFVGAKVQRGETPVPYNRALWYAALGYVLVAGVYHYWIFYGTLPNIPLLPWTFEVNDKTWLTVPRLAHILSLAYVVGHSPLLGWLRAAGPRNPVRLLGLMGRHSLPVFWIGTAGAMTGQVLMETVGMGRLKQLAFFAAVIVLKLAVAGFLDWLAAAEKAPRRARTPRPAAEPASIAAAV